METATVCTLRQDSNTEACLAGLIIQSFSLSRPRKTINFCLVNRAVQVRNTSPFMKTKISLFWSQPRYQCIKRADKFRGPV